jgi:hypothetical protein
MTDRVPETAPAHSEPEPRPLAGDTCFEEADFHALSEGLARDPQFDDARLRTRRKLGALGKRVVALGREGGLALDSRTSIHHPRVWNGMAVRRLWTYVMRAKSEKTRLRKVLGRDLAKDLDAAYRNAYLCIAIEADALEVSLRIHPEGWYDGQNLTNRIKAEGLDGLLDELNRLGGFRLRMHDWKGEWRLGELERGALEEYLSYYTPGEHRFAVERRWPAPAGARGGALEAGAADELVSEAARLFGLYRYAAWSESSPFLFQG